jgi:beta-lactamase class A
MIEFVGSARLRIVGIGSLMFFAPRVVAAQVRDSTMLDRRAAQVVGMLGGASIDPDTVFAPTFLGQVPVPKLRAALASVTTQLGDVSKVVRLAGPADAANHGVFQLWLSKGAARTITLDIDATPAHRISGLVFGLPPAASLDALLPEFHALPGQLSLLVARIDSGKLRPLAAIDSGRVLALGSAFKLYVLAELVRQVEHGTRHWTDVVLLDSLSRSLPSGTLQAWPIGTPVTIQTLATMMISISDNTAADQLLHLLGRDNVEQVQRSVGNTHAARNIPFLSTREMFALKSSAGSDLLPHYLADDVAQRRAVLANADRLPLVRINYDLGTAHPLAIESVEWFASAADLARTMLWLRDHTGSAVTAPAREILAVNPGLRLGDPWSYVGYKGGSETGVLNMTFLLRNRTGAWYVLTATWNNPGAAVNEGILGDLMARAGEALGRGVP